jgi:hypothetical protein
VVVDSASASQNDSRVFGDLHRFVDDMFKQFSATEPLFISVGGSLLHSPKTQVGEEQRGVGLLGRYGHRMRMDVLERDEHYAVHLEFQRRMSRSLWRAIT